MPLTTEKILNLKDQDKHAFLVDKRANKIEIMRAVKEFYGIKPINCRVTSIPEKSNARRRKRKSGKKAIVTFAKGNKFDPAKLK